MIRMAIIGKILFYINIDWNFLDIQNLNWQDLVQFFTTKVHFKVVTSSNLNYCFVLGLLKQFLSELEKKVYLYSTDSI